MKHKYAIYLACILIIIAFGLLFNYTSQVNNFLEVAYLKESQQTVNTWIIQHSIKAYVIYFFSIYFIALIDNLLAIAIFTTGGLFLNFWLSTMLAIISLTLTFMTKYFIIICILKSFNSSAWIIRKTAATVSHFEKYKFYYFFTTRFLPFCPVWLPMILAARANVSLLTFTSWTLFGTVSIVTIFTYFGLSLKNITLSWAATWNEIFLQPIVYTPILFFIIISLLFLLKKVLYTRKKNQKSSVKK